MVENPDLAQEHAPDYCNCCGQDLKGIIAVPDGKRQVFGIPKIGVKATGFENSVFVHDCCASHFNPHYSTKSEAR